MGRGAGSDDEGATQAPPDQRIDWLETRIQNLGKYKPDRIVKLMADEDSRGQMIDFLDEEEAKGMFIYTDPKGELKAGNPDHVNVTNKKGVKSVWFVKTAKQKIEMADLSRLVLCGDYADLQPLEHFNKMAQHVYLPLIEHAAIAQQWPDVLSKELMALFQKMVGQIVVTIGEKDGTTALPLPPREDSPLIDEKDRIFYLESCVVQWTAQIKLIMQADPEEKLKEGEHVGPEFEVEFWRFKASNLNAIQDQLKGPRVQKVLGVLESIKNTYVPVFLKLMEDVAVAAEEANENVKFLTPLEPHLIKLRDADEFTDLSKTFVLLMHNIMLVWKHSDSYSSPARLVVLMREICNDLIRQAEKFLEPETILEDEPQDAVDKLKTALKVVGTMKTVYFGYKARVALECPNNPWRFQNSALFVRLDSFLERCHDILELCSTVLQFSKLETVEVGGTKGRILTTSVAQIFHDFQTAIAKFHQIEYNLADVEADQFDDDFYIFRVAIKELERRLGSVVTQGFDDCTTVYSCFKLLDSFDVMLQREVIMQDLEKKHVDLVQSFGSDLKVVLDIFRGLKEHPIIGRNMPPVAGAVLWVRGLKERIQDPYIRFKTLHASAVMESEETKEVFKIYNLAIALFEEFEQKQFGGWCEAIESIGQDKLKQALLLRYTDGGFDGKGKGLPLLRVNFDPALTKLLREVKYLRLLHLEVPATAMQIFEKNETFRQQIGNLELLANVYNKILMNLKHVEKPMLQQKMDKIDDELKKGQTVLTWKSHGINEFIVQTTALVKDASDILIKINKNVDEMNGLLSAMKANIMFERKDQKCYAVEDFQFAHEAVIENRHGAVVDAGEKIHSLLVASNKVLRISKGAASWKAYQDYVAEIVINGLSECCRASMDHLFNQLSEEYLAKNDISPLLELKLELVGNDILYTPSVGGAHGNELRSTVIGWARDFMGVGKFVARLDTQEGDYLYELDEDISIIKKIGELNKKLDSTETGCHEFAAGYEKFQYLWIKGIDETFEDFMAAGAPIAEDAPQEEKDAAAVAGPTLAQFDTEIAKYNDVADEVSNLPNNFIVQWLKIDAKPIKQAISTWVSKWRYKFTQHLLDDLTNKITDLLEFVDSATVLLEKDVPEGDLDVLIEVMGCLRDVRARTDETDAMFEPLRNTVALLKKWNVAIEDTTMQGLDDAPQKWNAVKKQFYTTKERLGPQQDAEARKIRKEADQFGEEVQTFREGVKTQGPFEYNDKWLDAFATLKRFDGEIDAMEQKGNGINEMQDLFELTVTPFRDIVNSRREIVNLKSVWDMISMLVTTFAEYRSIKWADINTDSLTDECKKLAKIVKGLDKFTKNWNCYKGCEDAVKNMMTSLPLVSDLAHPSMRERHWKQLMRATGKNFTKDDSFTLGDLLKLGLHNFVEEVGEIVDRAQKELLIEKQLAKIEDTWSTLTLEYVPYGETEVMLVQLPEELVEALDDGQVQLQALGGNKYVAGNASFQDTVSQWQGKLGAVDTTIRTSWLEVQGKWTGLEPIFIGSADIRVQLPEDSKRFDGIDAGWKDLMKEAQEDTDPISAAQAEGRQELLDDMLKNLELCEKSLNDYLDTKKAAFPRFYFVAAADLLDILSKGSSPWLLQKHFSKNFDSINALRFEKNEDDSPSKLALGMISPENEFVQFHEPLLCEGPVEVWLNKVMDYMRLGLRHAQTVAYKAYDEKPRHQWQLDHCAQMSVLVSRIIYTSDVGQCFDKLEDGDDNAMKDYMDQCQVQLNHLSDLINGEMSKGDRKKTITMVTIDVHGRDVIGKLISARVEDFGCFEWQSQLRYRLREGDGECWINICDFDEPYTYEYIGNCGALVITPLTDRCYITLTQASRLVLGGAPAGPAGTGKTETTKDLGRALGIMVYVFNCSDQMDYRVMANIYKGLAQTGCWGCFDEFNRITIEVLSVCSTQYKMVLDGIRAQRDAGGHDALPTFVFDDEDVPLFKTAMAFITMNPGYAGRTELPESLKALFRPVSMVVPDMVLICEIMLFSEGFVSCKLLARKFMLCYNLATDLLSKAMHYDWKLRAVKTTLCVAGGMKRAAPELTEDKVLLRALRDFNLGKLLRDDVGIFMGLLNDLFPKTLELVPRAVFPDFEAVIKECTVAKGYQPDETFVIKITQLREIFEVRWSVFLLGPAGCGKSVVAEILMDSQNKFGERGMIKAHNPKAVTRNELYGFVSMATREWNDGLLSQLFRDFSNDSSYQHQWIILDGDIDAEWIETMNTVMDDNKILTLVSGERIPLTPPMRLLFEIADLRNASPATVSRAGVIYINDDDIGWRPFYMTWLDSRPDQSQKANLQSLMERYVEKTRIACLKNFKMTIPIVQINAVHTLCYLLDGVLGKGEDARKDLNDKPDLVETYFVWAMVWSFGGALLVDKSKDHKKAFSAWWNEEFKTVKFPSDSSVFDFCVDEKTNTLVDWSCEGYIHSPGEPVSNLYVDVPETARLSYIFRLLVHNHKGVMFVGGAGTGKTVCMQANIKALDEDDYVYSLMNLNSKTDSMTLQSIMEAQLEKKAGITFGPPGNKHIVYYIDDLNMPFVDKYGTQEPIAFLRCFVDYELMYEREKLGPRKVKNCEIVASLNPTAGSFVVDGRFQRQFATFSCQLPKTESLMTIYGNILNNHLMEFDAEVQEAGKAVTGAAGELQSGVANTFLPSAVKFHYIFNLRDISNVFGGLLRSESRFVSEPNVLVELFLHEANRVYRDRMISEADLTRFDGMLTETFNKYFKTVEGCEGCLEKSPLIFTNFCAGGADDSKPYLPVKSWDQLNKVLVDQLNEHNETNAVMNLVLFADAMEHVTRIARIIDQPRGNALLVGVGGSGKQSLARLAAYICQYEVYQIKISASYGIPQFLEDLQIMYKRAGVKSIGILFLFTDQQIVNEQMLVYLNDMLSSGDIPNLFPMEDVDDICNSVRGEVKQAGLIDTRDACWDFFISKTQKFLHTALAFSPVGDKFRIRAREFPALLSGTMIDWFHAWSTEALIAVANNFLGDLSMLDAELQENLANHMATVHNSVTQGSLKYRETARRYNYTTPKSFLELIALYKSMLQSKLGEIDVLKERLESGLEKLQATSEMVAELQESLVGEMAVVEEKKAATDALLVHVGQETSAAEEQKAAASVEEAAADAIAQEVAEVQASANKELEAAEPIIQAAEAALNSLDKGSLGELKGFGSPADAVVKVTSATLILTAGKPKVPKDLSWAAAKKMMGNVQAFLDGLIAFDKDNVEEVLVEAVETKFLDDPEFEVENIRSKSSAAAGLCSWCINICKYFRIYQMVAPKRASLAAANGKLDAANKKLEGLRAMLAELDAKLGKLTDQFETATAEKNAAIAQAEKTQAKADLALRLVNGLSSEGVRWAASIESFGVRQRTLIGDVLLASSFVSYVGAFTADFRTEFVNVNWVPDMVERQIPMTEGVTPIQVLASEAEIAGWSNENLPSDMVSVQNGAIICNSARWPLMIDPQLQGIGWITEKEKENGLVVTQLTEHKYIDKVEAAMTNGTTIVIENMGDAVDPVLDPVLARAIIKKGRSLIIKLGDKEVDYDQKFQLYLQTKLANPHYIPEVQAQCTLVNFTVTEKGLEDQLLALVVQFERPDLEEQRSELIRAENGFKVQLQGLEDNLLFKLANSEGDILEDIELIENLEETKVTSTEIQKKVAEGKETAKVINTSREVYRPVAARGSLMYFLVDMLNNLAHMYQYSMANFVDILNAGMIQTPKDDDVKKRIDSMVEVTSFRVFSYVASGLFERHKLIFASQLCFKIQFNQELIDPVAFNFLLRCPLETGTNNPCIEWLSDDAWAACRSLETTIEDFGGLCGDLEGSAKRWREWSEDPRAEAEPLPGDWKRVTPFNKLLVIRCIRPDRMAEALGTYVSDIIGTKYTVSASFDLGKSFIDSRPDVPIFVFLSPGVDVMASIEALHKKMCAEDPEGAINNAIISVSLGQGQEPVANRAIKKAHKEGGWVVLQNIHLTPGFCKKDLEPTLDKIADGAHPDFRLYLSAEPSNAMPIPVLQACVKLTNEPPDGMKANLKRSINYFTDDMLEECSKQSEFKAIVFATSYFHAVVLQRKKFGSIGFNFVYPFATGDLVNSAQTCVNYLENSSKVPWSDLRYLVGEVLYGGHVFNDWDRRLTNTYLELWFGDPLLDSIELFPGFATPGPLNLKGYNDYIDESFPAETPACFGLHANAEIGFRLSQANTMFEAIQSLQPRTAGGGAVMSVEDKAKLTLDEILDKLPDAFDLIDINDRLQGEERTPYTNVFLQEIERMNVLLAEMKNSLLELDLGLKGDLTISDAMTAMMDALFFEKIPMMWEKRSYPTLRSLTPWVSDVLERANQLNDWTGDLSVPKVTWFPGFFNPQSFLTAVMQTTARRNEWPLDKTVVQTEVTKKRDIEEIDAPSRDGSYIYGCMLEGCRWDDKIGQLGESFPKELFASIPVVLCKAVTVDKAEQKDSYPCPCYKTRMRPKGALGHPDGGYIFTAGLKSKEAISKWVMAGVALLTDISG